MRLIIPTVAISLFLLATSCLADIIVIKSANGKYYAIQDDITAPKLIPVRVIDLSSPDTPQPQPPDDKFGLKRVAKQNIPQYDGIEEDRTRLSAYIAGLSQAVASGAIEQSQLNRAFQEVLKLATTTNRDRWDTWYNSVSSKFAAAPIKSKEDAAQALKDISDAIRGNNVLDAIQWRELLQFFIEVILPLILELIKRPV